RVSHALPGVAGADRPNSARAFHVGQPGDGIGSTADLVGIGVLKTFEREPDLRRVRPEIELDQRRPEHRPRDPRSSLLDILDCDPAYGWNHRALLAGTSVTPIRS